MNNERNDPYFSFILLLAWHLACSGGNRSKFSHFRFVVKTYPQVFKCASAAYIQKYLEWPLFRRIFVRHASGPTQNKYCTFIAYSSVRCNICWHTLLFQSRFTTSKKYPDPWSRSFFLLWSKEQKQSLISKKWVWPVYACLPTGSTK